MMCLNFCKKPTTSATSRNIKSGPYFWMCLRFGAYFTKVLLQFTLQHEYSFTSKLLKLDLSFKTQCHICHPSSLALV